MTAFMGRSSRHFGLCVLELFILLLLFISVTGLSIYISAVKMKANFEILYP
jgi:hypothetical protein